MLLWQHLFWFFGHPEVYIIFIPGTGMVSAIVATFARRPVIGYPVIVLSLIATGFLSFGLWVHHMFVTGLPQLGASLFTATSMLIAVPSGIQIFCWLATLWDGRPVFRTPLLFVLGFVAIFVLGGLTGVMVASVPIDTAGPRHLFRRRAFPLRADRRRGVSPDRRRLLLVSENYRPHAERDALGNGILACIRGLQPRILPDAHSRAARDAAPRLHLHRRRSGWDALNMLSSVGAVLFAASFVVLIANVDAQPRPVRPPAIIPGEHRPWNGPRLHRRPDYNFSRIPVVGHRDPLWADPDQLPVVAGLSVEKREVLLGTVADAEPHTRSSSPQPSIWPLLTAITATHLLYRVDLHPVGGGLGHPTGIGGLDRLVLAVRRQGGRGVKQKIVRDIAELPTYGFGPTSVPWWGAMGFIAIEGMGFAIAIGAYLYLRRPIRNGRSTPLHQICGPAPLPPLYSSQASFPTKSPTELHIGWTLHASGSGWSSCRLSELDC